MKIVKRSGVRTDPWGTPRLSEALGDITLQYFDLSWFNWHTLILNTFILDINNGLFDNERTKKLIKKIIPFFTRIFPFFIILNLHQFSMLISKNLNSIFRKY